MGSLLPPVAIGGTAILVQESSRDDEPTLSYHAPMEHGIDGALLDEVASLCGLKGHLRAVRRELRRALGMLAPAVHYALIGQTIGCGLSIDAARLNGCTATTGWTCKADTLRKVLLAMGEAGLLRRTTGSLSSGKCSRWFPTDSLVELYRTQQHQYVTLIEHDAIWCARNRVRVELLQGRACRKHSDVGFQAGVDAGCKRCHTPKRQEELFGERLSDDDQHNKSFVAFAFRAEDAEKVRVRDHEMHRIREQYRAHAPHVACINLPGAFPLADSAVAPFMSYSGNADLGGRIYSRFIHSMAKKDYLAITLHGESVVELDLAALHISMYAHQNGLFVPENLYEACTEPSVDAFVDGGSRAVCKTLVSALMSAGAWTSARRATVEGYCRKHPNNSTCSKSINALIQKLKEYLAQHAGWMLELDDPLIGLRLQNQDSEVMLEVASWFASRGVTCLTRHDSILVPASQVDTGCTVLREVCGQLLGFVPRIKAIWLGADGVPESRYMDEALAKP